MTHRCIKPHVATLNMRDEHKSRTIREQLGVNLLATLVERKPSGVLLRLTGDPTTTFKVSHLTFHRNWEAV